MVSDFAAAFKELRLAVGLTQDGLARRVKVAKSYIGLVENGRRLPHPDLVAALDMALSGNGRLIALASTLRPSGRNMDVVDRRDVLKSIAAGTADLAVRPRSGSADVEMLLARTARLRRLDDVLGGGDTHVLYLREMRATRAIIGQSGYSMATGEALLRVLAEQAQLAGWAAFDAGWTAKASDLFRSSLEWARMASSSALAANALALEAYRLAFVGAPDIELAAESCRQLAADTPHQVQALVFERAAWTYAIAGQRAPSERALDQASAALAEAGDVAAPDWTAWVDHTELQIMTGRCRAAFNGGREASVPLAAALARFPDEYARDKALYSLALARAYVHEGHVEAAAQTVVRAAELSAGVASARPAMHIKQTAALLAPNAKLGAVAAMRERLRFLAQLELESDVKRSTQSR